LFGQVRVRIGAQRERRSRVLLGRRVALMQQRHGKAVMCEGQEVPPPAVGQQLDRIPEPTQLMIESLVSISALI
jgi:hypothetical protein